MTEEEEKKKDIIKRTLNLFSNHGIRSLNMGEICSLQRISKKTLYKFFKDKSDLVESCMHFELHRNNHEINSLMDKNLNAIDEGFEIFQHVIEQISELHPSLFWELENYYPDAYKLYEQHQDECIRVSITNNIEKGIKEGLYRSDLNIEIVVSLYLTLLYNLLSAKIINRKNFSFSKIYQELFIYHTHGLSSQKGLEYLQTKLKLNEH